MEKSNISADAPDQPEPEALPEGAQVREATPEEINAAFQQTMGELHRQIMHNVTQAGQVNIPAMVAHLQMLSLQVDVLVTMLANTGVFPMHQFWAHTLQAATQHLEQLRKPAIVVAHGLNGRERPN